MMFREGGAPLYALLAALGLLFLGIRLYVANNPSDDPMRFVIPVSGALLVGLAVTAIAGFASLAVAGRNGTQSDFFAFLGSMVGAIIFFASVITSGWAPTASSSDYRTVRYANAMEFALKQWISASTNSSKRFR